MIFLIGLFIIAVSILSCLNGCANNRVNVKVIKTPAEASVKELDLKDKSVILCDKNNCRVVQE